MRDRKIATQLGEARRRVAELEAELSRLRQGDPLTPGVLSLGAFRAQLELDVARAHRHGHPLAVALLDLDGFRRLNLEHGYAVGDATLGAVARLLAERSRVHDLACRTGGDEFAVLMPETGAPAAREAMEGVLARLEELEGGGPRGIAASIGIAVLEPAQAPEPLLAAARTALDDARSAGGNQVGMHRAGDERVPGLGEAGHADVIAALASALGERDRYTSDHSETVVDLTARVADALALPSAEVSRARTAALLHDVGKVGVPDSILHKPGPLDDREWEAMRQHPVIGERILRAIPGLGAVARIVRHEHERWDGGGYPDGISGTSIPIGSRIILACDAYHAMVSDRPYRAAMSHHEAIAELSANAGTQFDPDVVQVLVGYLFGRRQAGLAPV